MTKPFTFGVEFEMMVALICCESIEGRKTPDPSETRIVFFPPVDEPQDIRNYRKHPRKPLPAVFYLNRVQAEFKRIIGEAGFPVGATENDVSGWAVIGDSSLRHPPPGTVVDLEGYAWIGVEVKTPALSFTPESLQAVLDICALITKNFKVITNITTGLHVHIGHGAAGFALQDVAKIMAFTYAFEPQLSSLHPLHRYSHQYGGAMRSTSNLGTNYQSTYGEIPSALMAITKILTTTTKHTERDLRQKLSILVHTGFDGKMGNYNFNGVGDLAREAFRPTFEFRQHAGTMDGERVVQWVQLLVGILSFIENQPYGSFLRFLTTIVDEEKWDKLGDGKDAEREAKMGPILADGAFTVIDLLQHMGLSEQAAYYQNKVFKHDIPLIIPLCKLGLPVEADKSRRLFEKHRIARLASRLAGGDWEFDEEHPLWPPHKADPEFIEGSESDAE